MKKKNEIPSDMKKLLEANSMAVTTKKEIRINYIEKISMESDAKKIKHYQVSKNIL